MDIGNHLSNFAHERIEQFKEGLKMLPTIIWLVFSRMVFFTGFSFIVNFTFLLWFYLSRISDFSIFNVVFPLIASIGGIILMFFVAKSYGIECAVEFVWNKKKHVIFDLVASKTTQFLVNKKLPLTSESTWKWLAEKPAEIYQSMPFIFRMLIDFYFRKTSLAPIFSKIGSLKTQLSENPTETALVLSAEMQKEIQPELVQSSIWKVVVVLVLNIAAFVILNKIFP